MDGRDLREYNPRWFARQVAAVSSHPVLFNASIEENIRYAKADATHEDVVRVCQQALIDDDIERVLSLSLSLSLLLSLSFLRIL